MDRERERGPAATLAASFDAMVKTLAPTASASSFGMGKGAFQASSEGGEEGSGRKRKGDDSRASGDENELVVTASSKRLRGDSPGSDGGQSMSSDECAIAFRPWCGGTTGRTGPRSASVEKRVGWRVGAAPHSFHGSQDEKLSTRGCHEPMSASLDA